MIATESASAFLFLPAIPYAVLITLFYLQTDGFDNTSHGYSILKTLPVLALAVITYYRATMIRERERQFHALALLCGAIGDFLIGASSSAFVLGALAFGVGHVCYMI
ncbi:hypothetical protein L596_029479 [Steinernema carpocapsae]|uniref:lysoplasmalogenase n=1 Tax=Steinernema carpocapsae TaxID=34508 RepID=A0A4U5LUS7_STECR|nr:hypothetical protein L596_029479 [Steinernema carpocapsae]